MSKKVKITVKNVQKINKENKDLIETEAEGKFYIKRGIYYLIYKNISEGLKGAKTVIKIDPEKEKVLILRSEPVKMKQIFIKDSMEEGLYHTQYGKFNIKNNTSELEFKLNEKNGEIKLVYDLFINQEKTTSNKLIISYTTSDVGAN